MNYEEFRIAGAIRLLSQESSPNSIGITVFRCQSYPTNILFLSEEDRKFNIIDFYKIFDEEVYEKFHAIDTNSMGLEIDLHKNVRRDSAQVYCFFEGEKVFFYTRKSMVSDNEEVLEFLNRRKEDNSFASYSLLSFITDSISKKRDLISKTKFSNKRIWIDAELRLFQKRGYYWNIVQKSGFSKKYTSPANIGEFKNNSDMCIWIMENEHAYTDWDKEIYNKWISVWKHLSDFPKYRDVIVGLGVNFVTYASIFDPNSIQFLRRMWMDLDDSDIERIADFFEEEVHGLGDSDFIDRRKINISLEIHRVITNLLFRDIYSETISWNEIKKWFYSEKEKNNKKYIPTSKSKYTDWIDSSLVYVTYLLNSDVRYDFSNIKRIFGFFVYAIQEDHARLIAEDERFYLKKSIIKYIEDQDLFNFD